MSLMPGVKLFGFTDRDASHRKLEEVLEEGVYPRACCREDPNDREEPYQVWSDSHDSNAKVGG